MTLPVPRATHHLTAWDPLREIDALHRQMTQLVSAAFGASGLDDWRLSWTPLADVSETDDAYHVEVELPGVRREDVDVHVSGRELSVSGEFKQRERAGLFRTRTRRSGRFEYRTVLPEDIDADRVTAELADGVLTVRVPKQEAAKPRRVPVSG